MSPSTHRRIFCFTAAAATTAAGLVWRLGPLGLPPFWLKYGGSALWAAMIYWLVAAALPRKTILTTALIAATLAAAIEAFKLVHTTALDAFRFTLAGKLLLGRVFSFWDIAVYWLAIGISASFDKSQTHPHK